LCPNAFACGKRLAGRTLLETRPARSKVGIVAEQDYLTRDLLRKTVLLLVKGGIVDLDAHALRGLAADVLAPADELESHGSIGEGDE
jgi:hypothetical protein